MISFILPTGDPVIYGTVEFGAFCAHLGRLGGGPALKPVADAARGLMAIPPVPCWKAATELRRVTAQTAIPGLDPFDRGKLAALITGLEKAATANQPVTITNVDESLSAADKAA